MKRIFFSLCISLSSGMVSAQQEPITLGSLMKASSVHFTYQQTKVKDYLLAHPKPLSFYDEKGNTARLVDITPSGFPIYLTTLNAGAAITTGAVQLAGGGALGLNLQGQGMLVGVWDAGIVKDHIELGQRVIAKEGLVLDTHSTHVTGTLIATGINPAAKGMAPLAQVSSHDFDNDEAEMAALAKPDQSSLLFSSHSYGTATGWFKNSGVWEWTGDSTINPIEDYRFGFYDTRAQTMDQIAALAPYYTIVWATGNDRGDVGNGSKPPDCNGGSGFDCIIPEAVAKNIITVGAVNKVLTYSNPFDVSMSFFSSWGPTDDGRIKPDLVGAGVNLFSLSANGTNTYTTLSGTSMATPNVAGSLILLQELYSKIHGGDFMKAATLKALAIHNAKEAGSFPGPDYSFGWGLLDVAAASKTLLNQDGQNVMVKELSLQNGSSFSMDLAPKTNQKITATIAWTDPPANPLSPSLDPTTLNLVNDLDLRIIDDQGREQLPWALDPSNPSHKAVFDDNFRDNVEKLEFASPEARNYKLVVRHKSNLATSHQDFSLILSYQSITAPRIFYWVGDSGNWADGNHWSFASGGTPIFQIPGPGDQIIVDENSFDGIGIDLILLTQDASCSSLLWMNSKPSGISLNTNTLTISSQCIVGSPSFSVQTKGIFRFLGGSTSGNLFAPDGNLTNATLIFENGSWVVKGNIKVDELQFNSGTLNIAASKFSLARFLINSTTAKDLHLYQTEIRISASSILDGNSLTITADHSSLIIDSAVVTLQWQLVNFPGEIKISAGATLIVNGNNQIGEISSQGLLQLNGSNQIDTLFLAAGAEMDMGPSTVQALSSQTTLSGDAMKSVTITSPASSLLSFSDITKLCFDYLNISHVGITGTAVVNAGVHSILSNATNWQQNECDAILFADFETSFNCADGLTQFTNQSSGDITTYTWKLGSNDASIHDINPVKKFDATGSYPVTLTVTDHASTNSVTKNIDIVQNTLAPNQIIFNGNTLISFAVAERYQWFKDGIAEPGAINRSLAFDGNEGLYYVVAYDAQCNIVSDTLTIAGLADEEKAIVVFPNPASEWIKIKIPEKTNGNLKLTDLLGKNYLAQDIDQPELQLTTQWVPNGFYILQINLGSTKARRKILILHGGQ